MKSVYLKKFIPNISWHGKYYEVISHNYHMFLINLDANKDGESWNYKGELSIMVNGIWKKIVSNEDICSSQCGVQIEKNFNNMRDDFYEYIESVYTEEVVLTFNEILEK